ncbi:MAG TPA: MAPEG family protein [Rhizomicrobium sp.]|jgi:hypothetical protein
MILLPVTLATASVLGIIYVLLSVMVSGERNRAKIGLGTGAEMSSPLGEEHNASRLLVAVRRHGHFAEYVPFSLLLLGLLEMAGSTRALLLGLAIALVVARLMITFGLGRAAPNIWRAGGQTIQLAMILVACSVGLIDVVSR